MLIVQVRSLVGVAVMQWSGVLDWVLDITE